MKVILHTPWATTLGRFEPDEGRSIEVPDALFPYLPSTARITQQPKNKDAKIPDKYVKRDDFRAAMKSKNVTVGGEKAKSFSDTTIDAENRVAKRA